MCVRVYVCMCAYIYIYCYLHIKIHNAHPWARLRRAQARWRSGRGH